ncbi:hydroxypyruvate isomerase [Skermanella rosea]|uniref:2-oxo-tetronate isomerase n=1 Tax=Skermanella rosea TaxID=1817965 RepID=UPI0019332583|nr:2-oxo-tetronate isomerase [Skermanella rosea]UEM02073.1 hydroxypyruvate isomerase [Skermanella rosea]
MPKFAANLSMMFQEHDFLDRFGAAAKCGFRGVEYLFPYEWPAADIKRALDDAGLEQVLFNMPPGDWAGGERGMAAIPGREAEFAETVEKAIEYARVLDCPRLHAMAGIVHAGIDREEAEAVYVSNLRHAADAAARHGITLLAEPINSRDMPGYFLNTSTAGRKIMAAVSRPNLKLQFDIYHTQIMEGDLAERLRQNLEAIGHIQIAGTPGRHEPNIGEINYPFLFNLIDEIGYTGWIGCEYRPRAETRAGLGWAKEYGITAR